MGEKKQNSVIFDIVLLVIMTSAVLSASRWGFDANALPLLFGSITVIMLVYMTIKEYVLKVKDKKGSNTPQFLVGGFSMKQFLAGLAWVTGIFVAIFIFGFYVATVLFYLAFGLLNKYKWYSIVAYIGVSLFLEAFIFKEVLNVKLWFGCIPEIIPDIIGGSLLPPLF